MQALILDQKLKTLTASERKITYEILQVLQMMEITKSYRELGYSSLNSYLIKEMKYSEGAAQRRIAASRLLKQVPKVSQDLKSGNLNLTQMSLTRSAILQEEKVQQCKINQAKKTEILEKIKSKNTFETQKILKQELPSFVVPKPKLKVAGNDKIHVTLEFTENEWNQVQELMARNSHKVPDQKLESFLQHCYQVMKSQEHRQQEKMQKEKLQKQQASEMKVSEMIRQKEKMQKEVISEMKVSVASEVKVLEMIQQKECIQKKQTIEVKASDTKTSEEIKPKENLKSSDILPPLRRQAAADQTRKLVGPMNFRNKREYISKALKFQLFQKAQYQCEFVSKLTGKRCDGRHFLEMEHVIPVALGGLTTPENLRIYCREHNTLSAKKWGILRQE